MFNNMHSPNWFAMVCGYKFKPCQFGRFGYHSIDIYDGEKFIARSLRHYPIRLMKDLFIQKYLIVSTQECISHIMCCIIDYPFIRQYEYENYCNRINNRLK